MYVCIFCKQASVKVFRRYPVPLRMGIILAFLTKDSISAAKTGELSLKASTAEERIAFLSQYGWSVEEEPLEVKEIIIPAEFDDVYEKYNAIQKEQGFDLMSYCSKRVKNGPIR